MSYFLCSVKRDGVSMPHFNENYEQGKDQEIYSHEPIRIFDADNTVSLRKLFHIYICIYIYISNYFGINYAKESIY